jgi:DNA-binding LacI/PurR family transcriptional regulator
MSLTVSSNSCSADLLSAELMRMPNPPTAFFCGNDQTAMGGYEALKENGLRIPEELTADRSIPCLFPGEPS